VVVGDVYLENNGKKIDFKRKFIHTVLFESVDALSKPSRKVS